MGRVRAMIAALISGFGYAPGFVSARVQGAWGRSVGTKPDATEPWYGEYPPAGVEPPLAEVLSDPIVHLLMRADHLVPGEILPAAIVAEPPALRVASGSMFG
jgi:hypothetical protein